MGFLKTLKTRATTKTILASTMIVLIVGPMSAQYVERSYDLNQAGSLKLAEQAGLQAQRLTKNVSVAVLNSSGVTMLLIRGDDVGPHNTEASRRKAYTALSTRTPTFELMKKAAPDPTAQNLNSLPELLLWGGGVPIWKDGVLVGGIGVSGAGGGENDHDVAQKAAEALGFTIKKP